MCLADAIRAGHADRAYVVLGGDRWTLRDYYTSGALADHLIHAALVRVVTLEAFIRLANNGQLWNLPSGHRSFPDLSGLAVEEMHVQLAPFSPLASGGGSRKRVAALPCQSMCNT
jgi:hypothetical protein